MRSSRSFLGMAAASSLAVLAALPAIPTSRPGAIRAPLDGTVVTNGEHRSQPASDSRERPSDSRIHRLGVGGWMRQQGAPRGKRYSASTRQHQRHAAKRRNQARHRASAKG